jgi:hypothetical protein
MTLFFSSAASTKAPVLTPQEEMDAMRAEMERMKQSVRIRAKYGQNISDEVVAFYLEEERKTALSKKNKEAGRKQAILEEAKRDKEIRELAVRMVKDGVLRISTNGERVSKITTDLTLPCPHCGHPRVRPTDGIYHIVKTWYETPVDQRFGGFTPFIIRDCRNPLGNTVGILAWQSGDTCASCKKTVSDIAQLVMI